MGIVGGNKTAANSNGQTSTALMVLLLSAALFLIPGMREQYGKFTIMWITSIYTSDYLCINQFHKWKCDY